MANEDTQYPSNDGKFVGQAILFLALVTLQTSPSPTPTFDEILEQIRDLTGDPLFAMGEDE